MAPTTRKKNRISYAELDEDAFEWEDEEESEDLFVGRCAAADVDNAKPPAQKKPKVDKEKDVPAAKPPFEMLPPEVVSHMMLFLDNARDIYSLSMIGSKHVRGAITTEIVVRSAVFAGEKQKHRITELVEKGIQKKAVYLPDTFRLLRLLNGRQCERLELCYNYNLETKIPSTMGRELNQFSELNFGMLICKACTKVMSTKCGEGCPLHGRSVYSKLESKNLIREAQTERVTGQPVGPLLNAQQYHQLSATHGGHSNEKLDQAVDSIIADIPGYQEQHDNIVNSYQAAQAHRPRFIQSRRDILIEKQRLKDQERAERKLENQRKLLRRIERALSGYEYKDHVLKNSVEESNLNIYGPARIAFKELMDAPSTTTATKIQTALEEIKPAYNLLGEYGFLEGPEYLKHPRSFPREEYQTILYEYALENLDPLKILKGACCDRWYGLLWPQRFDSIRMEMLKEGRPFDFLMTFLYSKELKSAYKAYLLKQGGMKEDSIEYALSYRWLIAEWPCYMDFLDEESYRDYHFSRIWEGHLLIQKHYVEYQSYPAFVCWKEMNNLELGGDITSDMFDLWFLKEGDFEALLHIQKSKLQDG